MRIGIHCSTSGALVNAAKRAHEVGANCLQIFSASPRTWQVSMAPAEQIEALKAFRAAHDLAPLVVHDSYLINLAAPDAVVLEKSKLAFRGELERARAYGAEYLVMHPGSAKEQGVETGIARIAEAMAEAARGFESATLTLLLENTAGGGATIGRTFEELAELRARIINKVSFAVGYCLDTCHLYASGYDVASAAGLSETLEKAEQALRLARVPVIHMNDSQGELASRRDRHANIGEGHIGLEGFGRILHEARLRAKAFVLETPLDEPDDDRRNVDTLKKLCRKSRIATKKSS